MQHWQFLGCVFSYAMSVPFPFPLSLYLESIAPAPYTVIAHAFHVCAYLQDERHPQKEAKYGWGVWLVQMTLPLQHVSLAGWPPSTCAYQWGMHQATSWGAS